MGSGDRTGKVAVITGASSGIGAAAARALHTEGYQVALLARRLDRLQGLASKLGPGALAVEADVTSRDDLLAAARRVRAELGGTDVLVNNAGVMLLGPFGPDLDSAPSPPRKSFWTSCVSAAGTWSTFPPLRAGLPGPVTQCMPPPSGA